MRQPSLKLVSFNKGFLLSALPWSEGLSGALYCLSQTESHKKIDVASAGGDSADC